jgi:hypothetical protein
MGHCVGGYCDDVAANSTQIFSLRDAKGAPHVTIEVSPSEIPYPVSGEAFERLSNAEKAQYGEYIRAWRRRNPDVEDLTDENLYEALSEAGVPPNPPAIIQIKGKGNAAPAEKYLPAVQDFVSSRTWSNVGDLSTAQMMPIGNGRYISDAKVKEVADRHFINYFGNKPDESESAIEYYARIRRYNPDMLSEADKNFLDDIKNGNFAKGGEVLAYAQGGSITKKAKGGSVERVYNDRKYI